MVIANSVELFSLHPNWNGVIMLFFCNEFGHYFSKTFSNNLEKPDSKTMGQNSSRDFGDEVLGIG